MGKLTSTIGIPIKLLNEAQVRPNCFRSVLSLDSDITLLAWGRLGAWQVANIVLRAMS